MADSFAADVVRDIFRWKLEGVSAADIADRLNRDGILPPMEYKKRQGMIKVCNAFLRERASCLECNGNTAYIEKPGLYGDTGAGEEHYAKL